MLHYYDAINVRGLVPAHFPPRSYSTTLWRELENLYFAKQHTESKLKGRTLSVILKPKGKK